MCGGRKACVAPAKSFSSNYCRYDPAATGLVRLVRVMNVGDMVPQLVTPEHVRLVREMNASDMVPQVVTPEPVIDINDSPCQARDMRGQNSIQLAEME